MKESIKMPKVIFYMIVAMCATIIMANSIETMMKVKDNGLFNLWLSDSQKNMNIMGQTTEQLYSTYLTMCLSTFFIRVIAPMALAIHSYFTYMKRGVNGLFIFIWTVLILGSAGFMIISEGLYSIFFIINILAYIILVICILCMIKFIKYRKNL